MFGNCIKIAWRYLLNTKAYSAINIIGLATGMAVAILIGLWIWDECSFDTYHQHHHRLAQVWDTQTWNGETITNSGIAVPLANELRMQYKEDFKRIALAAPGTHILAVADKKISQSGVWAEPELPEILTLNMQAGSRHVLRDPGTILLSHTVAQALFGDTDPINKIVLVDNKLNMKVGGIYEDLPHNTTLYETKFMLPWDNTRNYWYRQSSDWSNHGSLLYVELNDHVDIDKTTAKIKNITKPHYKVGNEEILLFPMDKWHLYSEFKNGKITGGQIRFVWLFGIIGVFVLLLACINFMNLSTARSEKRAKEVGIRKAIGSIRLQLIIQFLTESLLVASLALLAALLIVQLLLPAFNNLSDKVMTIPWSYPPFWLLLLGFTGFTSLLAGSYPAFYLSAFEPIKVLKGAFSMGRFASLPRKVLVVVQFTVSITLIIGTIIVFRQIQFAKNRPVGYTREGLITIDMNTPDIYQHYDALRNDLIQTGAVADMAESNSSPTQIWSSNTDLDWKGKDPNFLPVFGTIAVTHDFGNTVDWKVLEGRDFSRNFPGDSGAFILNQSAAKLTGFKNPVGQTMRWLDKDHVITGVVADMVMNSPYEPILPTIFHMEYDWVRLITLRIKPGMSMPEALAKIAPVFKKYDPGSPFQYKFTDEEYARKFSDEQRIGNLATVFAILAIFISCLGLFGLASFVAEQRTKEIGVRKVLGASVFNLWIMLSKDFAVLVIISCLVAIPVAFYFLNQWLKNYIYHTTMSWWIFAIAGMGALLITILTVSYQSIKAALTNPVKSLRSE
jgi:putative ABC transport system permease protein